VYQIFFLNCTLFPQSAKLPRRYSYREEEEHDRLSDITEIIFYELPKLGRRVREILKGKIKPETLSEEEKWCIFMRYRHEKKASELVKELCRKEEGIMHAEKAVAKVSRDYRRYAREVAEIKNNIDGYYRIRAEERRDVARKLKAMGDNTKKIQAVTGLSAEVITRL